MILLTEYNQDEFHLLHAQTVENTMRYFARELGFADEEDFWGIVGLLHDLGFEKYPEEHCIKSQEIMKERGIDEKIIHATASHGYAITVDILSLIHISEPTRRTPISYAVFCLKKKQTNNKKKQKTTLINHQY